MDTTSIRDAIERQYGKATGILADAIDAYDEEIWFDTSSYQSPAWRVAYHAIFFTNLYCAANQEALRPWPLERENYEQLGPTPWPPHERIPAHEPYSSEQMRAYLTFVQEHIPAYLDAFEPEARCWPPWYEQNQLEFHFNNLRHLQHHTAELIERHDIATGFPYHWR